MSTGVSQKTNWIGPSTIISSLLILAFLGLYGCVAAQADLRQTEREFQRLMKQTTEEQAQARARQNQEIVSLREQDIPALRGDIDKAIHRLQTLGASQQDLFRRLDAVDAAVAQHLNSPGSTEGKEQTTKLGGQSSDPKTLERCESRLDQNDELVLSMLMQIEEISRALKELKPQDRKGRP